MDACRRVVAALLFTLWAAGGVPLPGAVTVQSDHATRSGQVGAMGCRHEGQVRVSDESSGRSSFNGAGGGRALAGATAMPTPASADLSGALAANPTTKSTRRGDLAGKPRGPPTAV